MLAQFLHSVAALTTYLERENALIKQHKLREVLAGKQNKEKLWEDYQRQFNHAKEQNFLGGKEKLLSDGEVIGEAIAEAGEEALGQAIAAEEAIGKAITDGKTPLTTEEKKHILRMLQQLIELAEENQQLIGDVLQSYARTLNRVAHSATKAATDYVQLYTRQGCYPAKGTTMTPLAARPVAVILTRDL